MLTPQETTKKAQKTSVPPTKRNPILQPQTVEELYRSLCCPDEVKAKGKVVNRTPWAEWDTSRNPVVVCQERIDFFLAHCARIGQRVRWVPVGGWDRTSNAGVIEMSSCPISALTEVVINSMDAHIELAVQQALARGEAAPQSMKEARERFFPQFKTIPETRETGRVWSPKNLWIHTYPIKDHSTTILDVRDTGIGIAPDDFAHTILSLNQSNKVGKPYLVGKFGQGGSTRFRFSAITILVSRKYGEDEVGFTFVRATRQAGYKSPTYEYLTLDGSVLRVKAPDFQHGMFARHIGYEAEKFNSTFGGNSVYDVLNRKIPEPFLPIHTVYHHFDEKNTGTPNPHMVYGLINKTFYKDSEKTGNGRDFAYSQEYFFPLGSHQTKSWEKAEDYGAVRFRIFVLEPREDSERGTDNRQSSIKSWVDPHKPIMVTLHGQTHAEESKALLLGARDLTGISGAALGFVGRHMFVQVVCDDVSPIGHHELFVSDRERARDNWLRKIILNNLVDFLKKDQRLKELDQEYARAFNHSPKKEDFSDAFKEYLKGAGVDPKSLLRPACKGVDDISERNPDVRGRHERLPIPTLDPPTMIEWCHGREEVGHIYMGQRTSWTFETNAAPHYWEPGNPRSLISVTTSGAIKFVGSAEMKGGRVRCYFEPTPEAKPGDLGKILVTLQVSHTASQCFQSRYDIEVRERDTKVDPEGQKTHSKHEGKLNLEGFLPPVPIQPTDSAWHNILRWPTSVEEVGFTWILSGGTLRVYYNAAHPTLLKHQRDLDIDGLGQAFTNEFEMYLLQSVLQYVSEQCEPEAVEDGAQRKVYQDMLLASMKSIMAGAHKVCKQEQKLKQATMKQV